MIILEIVSPFIPVDMKNVLDTCGNCPFFKHEDMYGHGWCDLIEGKTYCSDKCNYVEAYEFMTPKRALKVLHSFQKWRRGGKGKMIDPLIIGYAIDEAIRTLRKEIRNESMEKT